MLNLVGVRETAGIIMPQKRREAVEIKNRKCSTGECLLVGSGLFARSAGRDKQFNVLT
jgi:hypothetical protein